MAMHEVTERLYYTRDKSRVVKEGDPEAAFLFATPGTSVPMEEAERVGLTGKKAAAPEPMVVHSVAADPAPAAESQAVAPPVEAPNVPDETDETEDDASDDAGDDGPDVADKAVRGPRGVRRSH